MERWYFDALALWSKRVGRAPAIHELAGWLSKSHTAVYSALISLEHKRWVTRVGGGQKKNRSNRRFVVVPNEGT